MTHNHPDSLVVCAKCNKRSTWSETVKVMEFLKENDLEYAVFRLCKECHASEYEI